MSEAGNLTVAIHGHADVRDRVLTPEAIGFLSELHERFEGGRMELLSARQSRQAEIDRGVLPRQRTETPGGDQAGEWRVAAAPGDLLDRRVEITGPVDRKMVINALNSGARVFMADFEDSLSPTWANVLDGQANLHDAIRRQLDFTSPEGRSTVLPNAPRRWSYARVDGT
jgi:malate synthase